MTDEVLKSGDPVALLAHGDTVSRQRSAAAGSAGVRAQAHGAHGK